MMATIPGLPGDLHCFKAVLKDCKMAMEWQKEARSAAVFCGLQLRTKIRPDRMTCIDLTGCVGCAVKL